MRFYFFNYPSIRRSVPRIHVRLAPWVSWDPLFAGSTGPILSYLSLTMGSAFTPHVYCHSAALPFLREG